jgi:hypothetical protein
MGNEPLGKPRLITLHWTAGSYQQTFNSYHFNVTGDGRVITTLPLSAKGSHVWGRNTGNIGVALCAMANARTLPTKRQLEATAALVADLSVQFDIGFDEVELCQRHKVSNSQRIAIDGQMAVRRIADHAAYARCDGYYPDRWDCGRYTEEILKSARWYAEKVREGERPRHNW